jgi:hypothetical protein
MQFSHRDDPGRTATLVQRGDEPVFVVEHTDAKGKARSTSFKKPSAWQAQTAALRFLLNTEGYILRAPQDGPVEWMARLMLDGYRGEITHAVDPESGVVWVHDAQDQLHRITPGTCATTMMRLGSGTESPRASVAVGADAGAWCAAPTWDRVGDGLIRRFRVYRVVGAAPVVELVANLVGPELVAQLSATRDGRVLGPAAGGAGLYGPDGLERRFACTPGDGSPVAAISPSGEWLVTSHADHMIREQLASGAQTRLRADGFKGFDGVQICDDGSVYTSGFRYPSHGLWRLGDDEPRRVSADTRATVRADGQVLAEVEHGRVSLCDPNREGEDELELAYVLAKAELPVLGMAKYGRAAFGPGGKLAVLTDAYTVACVVL